jgi:hypothetical protein
LPDYVFSENKYIFLWLLMRQPPFLQREIPSQEKLEKKLLLPGKK